MTAEDPVEYNLFGINQVLVRTEIGLTFAAALKAFLRQDPNIIMVGEIRDLETGGIAIKAALTGHLVLSTLHTNDAPEHDHPSDRHGPRAVQRGVRGEPGRRAAAGATRSARTARRRTTYTDEELHPLGTDLDVLRGLQFFKGTGCDTCGGTGYKGRQGLYEVMAMTPGAPPDDPAGRLGRRSCAIRRSRKACSTLRMDGMKKIERGVTTLEEVVKETGRMTPCNLRALLEEMIEKDASDLHITAGERPKLRVDGDIVDSAIIETC